MERLNIKTINEALIEKAISIINKRIEDKEDPQTIKLFIVYLKEKTFKDIPELMAWCDHAINFVSYLKGDNSND